MAKKILPASVRTFVDTVSGERSPITEKDFSPEELQQVRDAIKNSRQRQMPQIEKARDLLKTHTAQTNPRVQAGLKKMMKVDQTAGYQDYGSGERGKRVENDFNLGSSGAMRNTLGRFSYEKTPDGRLIAKDTYDFKDDLVKEAGVRPTSDYEKMGTLGKIGTLAADTVLPWKGGPATLPSRIGSAFIGRDGRPVEIDLGKADFKKGGKVKAKTKTISKPKVSKASSRGDGIAQRGKTKGRII
jgi:hypothetical protein